MKRNLRRSLLAFLAGLVAFCAITVLIETQFKILQRAYDNFVLDNRNHYLSCSDLPTKSEVERIVEQHRDIVQQIQEIAPGIVSIEIDTAVCDGNADLLISYGTHEQRVAIENIIASETFFGIPYRLQNR